MTAAVLGVFLVAGPLNPLTFRKKKQKSCPYWIYAYPITTLYIEKDPVHKSISLMEC